MNGPVAAKRAHLAASLRPLRAALTALTLVAALAAAGCAGQALHRDGLALVESGRLEEGLAKLAEATRADPGNLTYRADLLRQREQATNRLLATASGHRAAERWDAAQALYERVLAIEPDQTRASQALQSLALERRQDQAVTRAAEWFGRGDLDAARLALQPVLAESPRHGKALLLQRRIDEELAKQQVAEPVLRPSFRKPVTLQFRDGNLRMVFEAISRITGVNILLDKDVRPDLKTTIFVKDVSVEDTIDLILLHNQLEKKVLGDSTVFVYPSTPAKLKEYQDLKIRSFHLTNADPKQMLTMLKTLLKTKDAFVHEKTNSIVIRDTPAAIRLAEKLIADQDAPDPEVMLEVEVLEITRARLSELGIKFPDALTLGTPGGVGAAALTLEQLRNLSSGALLTSPLAATLNLKLQDGETNLLASPRIRARNREKAKILIGDRVPVITNAVTPVSTGTPVVTGTVQYLDVGLKLEVEPDIHADGEVAMKVSLEVSSIVRDVINAQSGSVAYQIGTRNAATVLRLKDGETQVLAGLINDEDRRSASKLPGLGQLPVLGRLFSSHGGNVGKTEIVLSITPRLVGRRWLPDARHVEYWAGTETSLRSHPLLLRPIGSVTASAAGSAAAATPAASARPARRTLATPAAPMEPPGAGGTPGATERAALALAWEGPSLAKVGERISVTLAASSVHEVGGLGLLVSFDPTVLRAADALEGTFLKQNGFASSFNQSIDQAGGQVLVDIAGPGSGGVSGAGSVVTLVFEVIAEKPQTQLTVSRVAPQGAGGEAIPVVAPEPHRITLVR